MEAEGNVKFNSLDELYEHATAVRALDEYRFKYILPFMAIRRLPPNWAEYQRRVDEVDRMRVAWIVG